MGGLACVQCRKFFRVKKIGVAFEEGMPGGGSAQPCDADGWGPYKLWMADLAECPGCGAQVLYTPIGAHPVAEHYKPDYVVSRARARPIMRVDDAGGKRP